MTGVHPHQRNEPLPSAAGTPVPSRKWRIAGRLAFYLVVAVTVWSLVGYIEKQLVFPGARYKQGFWEQPHLAPEDIFFQASDGVRLHGWYVEHENPDVHILYCHGNGGNVSHRTEVLKLLNREMNASVFIFDYRGYGQSEGSPNEQGVMADARAARQWLATRAGIPQENILLLGRSIGGAVATGLADEAPCRALVLESTFATLPDAAGKHYPWLPVRWVMQNRFNSMEKISTYQGPLLQSHSRADSIIPFEHGRRLFDACPSEDKTFFTIENIGHNSSQPVAYYDLFADLIKRTSTGGTENSGINRINKPR